MTHGNCSESAWLLNKMSKFLAKRNSYDIINLHVSKLIIFLHLCEISQWSESKTSK